MLNTFGVALLAAILLIAAVSDCLTYKVYNWLTFPAMALGLALNAAAHHWAGLGFGVLGLAVGGLIFFRCFGGAAWAPATSSSWR